jgi:archaellum component FlaC
MINGQPLSWDAPETSDLLKSFLPPFQFNLGSLFLSWKFSKDYPTFPIIKGGFKKWNNEQARECDFALVPGYMSLVPSYPTPSINPSQQNSSILSNASVALDPTSSISAFTPTLPPHARSFLETSKHNEVQPMPAAEFTFKRHPSKALKSSSGRPLSVVDLTDESSRSVTVDPKLKTDTQKIDEVVPKNEPNEDSVFATLSTTSETETQKIHAAPLKKEPSNPSISVSASPEPRTDIQSVDAAAVEQQPNQSSISATAGLYSMIDTQKIHEAALKKQSEEVSALKAQLNIAQTQAATHQAKVLILQLELDAAKSSLKQNAAEMDDLRSQLQQMKDHINKRSSVICGHDVEIEKLQEQVEMLEKKVEQLENQASKSPATTESLPEVSMQNESKAGVGILNTVDMRLDCQAPSTRSSPSLQETHVKVVDAPSESDYKSPSPYQNLQEVANIAGREEALASIPDRAAVFAKELGLTVDDFLTQPSRGNAGEKVCIPFLSHAPKTNISVADIHLNHLQELERLSFTSPAKRNASEAAPRLLRFGTSFSRLGETERKGHYRRRSHLTTESHQHP